MRHLFIVQYAKYSVIVYSVRKIRNLTRETSEALEVLIIFRQCYFITYIGGTYGLCVFCFHAFWSSFTLSRRTLVTSLFIFKSHCQNTKVKKQLRSKSAFITGEQVDILLFCTRKCWNVLFLFCL